MDEAPNPGRRNFLRGRLAAPSPPVAAIGQSCFAFRGVACMSCRDACATGAVRFELMPGGARPRVLADACTGCGDCASVCPAGAIQVAQPEAHA